MNFYIHIGTHKTGSTALQYFFQQNKDKLQEHGFYYPTEGVVDAGHHQIAWAAKKKETGELADLMSAVMDAANKKKCSSIILSSEEFEFIRDVNCLKNLKNVLGEHTYKIIVFLRRQDTLLESEYNQHIKHANTQYRHSIYKFYFDIDFSHRFDYKQLCRFWGGEFGKNAIHAINYELCCQDPLSIFNRFFAILGLTLDDSFSYPKKQHSNPSLPSEATLYMARLNRFPLNMEQRQRAIKTLSDTFSNATTVLSYADRKKIWARNRFTNNFIVANFGFDRFCAPENTEENNQYVDFYDDFDKELFDKLIHNLELNDCAT